MDDKDELFRKATQRIVDRGDPVASGWAIFKKMFLPPDVPEPQLKDMMIAYFAGADFLFGCITQMQEKGNEEPTEQELARMDKVEAELAPFRKFLNDLYLARQKENKDVRPN